MQEERTVAEFRKNKHETVRAMLRRWKGQELLDLRVCYRTEKGDLLPGPKGLALRVELLPELAAAVAALVKAVAAQESEW